MKFRIDFGGLNDMEKKYVLDALEIMDLALPDELFATLRTNGGTIKIMREHLPYRNIFSFYVYERENMNKEVRRKILLSNENEIFKVLKDDSVKIFTLEAGARYRDEDYNALSSLRVYSRKGFGTSPPEARGVYKIFDFTVFEKEGNDVVDVAKGIYELIKKEREPIIKMTKQLEDKGIYRSLWRYGIEHLKKGERIDNPPKFNYRLEYEMTLDEIFNRDLILFDPYISSGNIYETLMKSTKSPQQVLLENISDCGWNIYSILMQDVIREEMPGASLEDIKKFIGSLSEEKLRDIMTYVRDRGENIKNRLKIDGPKYTHQNGEEEARDRIKKYMAEILNQC